MTAYIQVIDLSSLTSLPLTYYNCTVPAGMPSPAEPFEDERLDLHQYLSMNKAHICAVRIHGNDDHDSDLYSADLLIVDRSLKARVGHSVIVEIEGRLMIRKLERTRYGICFKAYKDPTLPTKLRLGPEHKIWGVVIHVLHKV